MPQQPPPTSAANVDSGTVKTIASLYASRADKEADALYRETSIDMSARVRLKLSRIIEKEIRRIQKASKGKRVAQPSATRIPDSHFASNPVDWKAVEGKPNPFGRVWDSLSDSAATLLENGTYFLYFAFWVALAIVIFHMACRIIL